MGCSGNFNTIQHLVFLTAVLLTCLTLLFCTNKSKKMLCDISKKNSCKDPVVRRGDKFIARINHATPRINFILGLNCIAQSSDKFILGINGANPGIKLTQRLSRVKSLSCCFFVMKHYGKQFCRYTCFSNNN